MTTKQDFFYVAFKNFSGRRVVIFVFFLLMSFLSKQTAVRGPTGGGRPPVTGFYSNPWVCDICVADSVKDYSKTGKILDAGVLNNGVF